jgi:hypothetical protein
MTRPSKISTKKSGLALPGKGVGVINRKSAIPLEAAAGVGRLSQGTSELLQVLDRVRAMVEGTIEDSGRWRPRIHIANPGNQPCMGGVTGFELLRRLAMTVGPVAQSATQIRPSARIQNTHIFILCEIGDGIVKGVNC